MLPAAGRTVRPGTPASAVTANAAWSASVRSSSARAAAMAGASERSVGTSACVGRWGPTMRVVSARTPARTPEAVSTPAASWRSSHPQRQPGTTDCLDSPPTVRTGTSPETDDRGVHGTPSNAIPAYTSSAMMGSRAADATAATAARCAAE